MNEKLFQTIQEIRRNEYIFNMDEAAIKQAVILRILNALGWNPFDINEVSPEYSVGGGRVDYALKHKGKPKVFIEVKKPAESLENHHEQLLGYAFKEGVRLAVLTNGVSWWFYLPLMEGRWEDRKFYAIDLLDQNMEDIIDKFEKFLSKSNVISGKALEYAEEIYRNREKDKVLKKALPEAWRRIIEEPNEELVNLVAEMTERISGYTPDLDMVEAFLKQLAENYHEVRFNRPEKEKSRSPKLVRSRKKPPDYFTGKSIVAFTFKGRRIPVASWKEFLVKLSEILHTLHGEDFERVLSLRGRKRPYFSRDRKELRFPELIKGTDIYVETNMSARRIVDITRRMLKLFGYPEDALSIEVK